MEYSVRVIVKGKPMLGELITPEHIENAIAESERVYKHIGGFVGTKGVNHNPCVVIRDNTTDKTEHDMLCDKEEYNLWYKKLFHMGEYA